MVDSTSPAIISSSSTKEQVHEWAKQLFLSERLDAEDADIPLKQKVTGKVLLTLTEAKLLSPPYNMLGGPATALSLAIESYKIKLSADVKKMTALKKLGLSPTAETITKMSTTDDLKQALKTVSLDGQKIPKEDSSTRETIAWLLNTVPELDFDMVLHLVELDLNGKVLLTLTEAKLLSPPYNMLGGPAAVLALAIEKLMRAQKPGIDSQSSINNAPKIMYIISYHYYHHYRTYY